jgi:serine/threonine protein kinase/tetratricopeptide (TPR) repeat protein
MTERDLFIAALQKDDPGQRRDYLREVCGSNLALLVRVEGLLRVYEDADSFLESPPSPPTITVESPSLSEGPGIVIGPYKLMEPIGEGGMGVVYMAEQQKPVRRKVALKIIKPGMDSRQVIARFEAERQALALMDHPNIAHVLEAGTTESGRPYFVMELVRGIPITDYCDHEELPITDRLELFVLVCQAVQHAHQKGIIHRDLKPSNVLVTLHDGVPVPKVIDFGIAKAMGQLLTEKTLYTSFAQLVGTPLYMSPEQAEWSGLDVDTRSDIYSLGVLLYELLTGSTPFDAETFRKAGVDEIRRIIREQEPPRPSTRLSTLSDTLPIVSSNRGSEPRKLAYSLRGELDWIVMKCLEKDRRRRYETASGLVADLRRHLNHEPVEAGPPSAWYRLRKLARRNRPALVTAAVVAGALVLGTAVATWQAVRARRETARATDAEGLAQKRLEAERRALSQADRLLGEVTQERNQANLARQEADQSAAEAKAVVAFVVDDVLGAAAPSKTRGTEITVLGALANADGSLEGKFAREPRVEASVREALAKVYQELGEYEKAEGHAARALALREKALGAEHEATLSALGTLGWTYCLQGKREKYEQAEAHYRRMLEACRRTRGEGDELTLNAMNGLAAILLEEGSAALPGLPQEGKLDESAILRQQILDIRRRTKGSEDPKTLSATNDQAVWLMAEGKLKEAESLLRDAVQANVKHKPEDLGTLIQMSNYASLLFQLSRNGEAAGWATRSMDAHLRVLKLKHPRTHGAVAMAVATTCVDQRFDEALAIIDRALKQARDEFGPDDLTTINYLNLRVGVLRGMGNLEQARSNAEEVLAARSRKLGPEDPGVLEALASLADIRRHQGATDEARKLFARLHNAAQRALDKQVEWSDSNALRAETWWADRLARNLGRPGWSDRSRFPPGAPGGPPLIDAPFQTRSPIADGHIEPGEYSDGDGFSFDFAKDPNPGGSHLIPAPNLVPKLIKDPSDLSVQMHIVHTATALYFAFRVRDQSVRARQEVTGKPWLNDCIEVYLDGDRVANDYTPALYGGNREGFKLGADALGNRIPAPADVGDARWKAGAARTEDGYVIEFEVPLDLIDTQDGPGLRPATTGSELRMGVSIIDFDGAATKQSSYGVIWCDDRQWSLAYAGEDFWPVALRLTPAPAPHR